MIEDATASLAIFAAIRRASSHDGNKAWAAGFF
jgi:hypothetical protein